MQKNCSFLQIYDNDNTTIDLLRENVHSNIEETVRNCTCSLGCVYTFGCKTSITVISVVVSIPSLSQSTYKTEEYNITELADGKHTGRNYAMKTDLQYRPMKLLLYHDDAIVFFLKEDNG